FKALVTSVENGSLVSSLEKSNLKYTVRKYQDYFLAQTIILKDTDSNKAGDIYASCYYFKKVAL
ncbi:MAG: hypothetical protein ACK5V3_01385, partial [Bdellovibrionales bacterium]